MRNLSENYAPKVNFWETYPAFKDVNPFRDLHAKDKSPGKRISSMKMWFLSLIYCPESDFYNLPGKEEKSKESIEKNFRMKLDISELEELREDFYAMTLSQADKSLLEWENRMKERDEFLRKQEWSFDTYSDEGKLIKGTADQLDKMHSQTAKHFIEYEKIYKMVQELRLKEENAKKKSNVQELDV